MFAFKNSVFFWNCVISQDEKSERKSYLLTVNQKSPWEIKNAILEEKNGLDAHKIKVWHHKEKKQQQYCCLK